MRHLELPEPPPAPEPAFFDASVYPGETAQIGRHRLDAHRRRRATSSRARSFRSGCAAKSAISSRIATGIGISACAIAPRRSAASCGIAISAAFAAPPDDGMQVAALGRLTVYPTRGEMQFAITRIEAEGDGLRRKALEITRARLEADGLLDPRAQARAAALSARHRRRHEPRRRRAARHHRRRAPARSGSPTRRRPGSGAGRHGAPASCATRSTA